MVDLIKFDMGMPRLEKADPKVNYRAKADAQGWSCGGCRFFMEDCNGCSLVEGLIDSTYTCDLWTAQTPDQIEQDLANNQMQSPMSDPGAYHDKAFQVFVDVPEDFAEIDFSKPQWIPFLPKPGHFAHPTYGDIDITKEDNTARVASVKDKVYQEHIPMDLEHQTKLSGAAGYIKDMKMNSDGSADALVEWAARGQKVLAEGAYRYVSPEWFPTWRDPATGIIHRNVVAGGAITTRPFFKDKVLRALVASEVVVNSEVKKEYSMTSEEKKAADDKAAADAKANEPKTYAEGSPELQAIIAKAIDEYKVANPVKASEPDPEAAKSFAELNNRLTAAETAAKDEKAARETMAKELETNRKVDRERRFTDLVAGRGGAGDGAAWAGNPAANVAILTSMAESFGEDAETFTKFTEQQAAIAAQLKEANLFTEVGSAGRGPAGSGESADAKIESLARQRMAADPKLTYARAFSEVMESPEAKRLYDSAHGPRG